MQQPARKNWLERNWKWAVPTGCLGMLVLFLGGLALLLAIVFSAIRSSDVYQQAIARVQASGAVAEALGTPIEPGWFAGGNIQVSGPTGSAALSIPLSGPKGSGTLYVEARKAAGEWRFTILAVRIDASGRRIDLLGAPPS